MWDRQSSSLTLYLLQYTQFNLTFWFVISYRALYQVWGISHFFQTLGKGYVLSCIRWTRVICRGDNLVTVVIKHKNQNMDMLIHRASHLWHWHVGQQLLLPKTPPSIHPSINPFIHPSTLHWGCLKTPLEGDLFGTIAWAPRLL